LAGQLARLDGTPGVVLPATTDAGPAEYRVSFVGSTGAVVPISTVSTPAVPAVPITITGTGEQVETVDLVATGYTVKYKASSFTLVVLPVQADGSDGMYVVDVIGQDTSRGVSGTTTYRATGRTTFHITNTDGPWSLTFTPLS
jgi:hypothetical protein